MYRLTLLAQCLLLMHFLNCQTPNPCNTDDYINNNKALKEAYDKTFEQAKKRALSNYKRSNAVYKIPVVVHIVYENSTENIDDSLVYSQIEVLNEDYRRNNSDTSNTRTEFDSLATDTKIEFFLATIDPDGNSSSGITRTQTSETSFIDFSFNMDKVKSSLTGGVNAWPVDQYLNIWVCDLSIMNNPFVLGFAYPPVNAPNWPAGSTPTDSLNDGVVIHYEVFGRNNPLSNLSMGANSVIADRGRTCVHEVGHYFGLRHIWGDGDCSEDDGIDDTPLSDSEANFDCNLTKNTCVDNPYDYPDMIENYMDYSADDCMNLFTNGQSDIMRSMLETSRNGLISSDDTMPAAGINEDLILHANIFPNPAQKHINIELKNSNNINHWKLYDIYGKVVNYDHVIDKSGFSIKRDDLPSGIYILVLEDKLLRYRQKIHFK